MYSWLWILWSPGRLCLKTFYAWSSGFGENFHFGVGKTGVSQVPQRQPLEVEDVKPRKTHDIVLNLCFVHLIREGKNQSKLFRYSTFIAAGELLHTDIARSITKHGSKKSDRSSVLIQADISYQKLFTFVSKEMLKKYSNFKTHQRLAVSARII